MRAPWLDRSGKLSALKAVAFAALFIPGIATAAQYASGAFAAEPIKSIIHETGLWALRFLLISLAITPARQIYRLPKLILVRRMIGLAAFAYAAIHLTFFAADKMFDIAKIATEIASRIYLTIGFGVLLMLLALAATSTDAAVRRMGAARWQALHRIVYVAALFALVHFFMQSKLDVTEPTIMAGFFAWLMGYRLVAWMRPRNRSVGWASLLVLAAGAGLITALGEALYFELVRNVAFERVLNANVNWAIAPRPALAVFLAGIAVLLSGALRSWSMSFRTPAERTGIAR